MSSTTVELLNQSAPQAALLLQHGPAPSCEAFLASRVLAL